MRKRLLNLCLTALMSVVSTAAWALSDVNGVYQISSAEDFNEFAALVNDGAVTANAVLTADIDLGMEVTMVGINDNDGAYHGTFDGQGHTIKINMYPEENYAALFRYVGWRAVIENLKVEGTITTSSKFAAGIAGRNRGTIRNCWADVVIKSSVAGDATHGGLAGTATNGCIIENCLVQVSIVGEATQNCGGVIGWADSRVNIVNCLVLNDGSSFDISNGNSYNISRNPGNVLGVVNLETYNSDNYANRAAPMCYNNYVTTNWKDNNGATVVPFEDLADGRICYQLNNDQSRIGWVQNIGVDPFPVPAAFGEGQVFASGATDCDGKSEEELTFSNNGSDQATKHNFDKYGICTNCGLFNFHFFDPDDPTKFDAVSRSVLLGSKEDIDQAEGLNRVVNGFKLHMKMVNDITYIAEPGHFIFNANDWQEGDFNGDGHELTIGMTDMGNNAALFPQRHYGSVENLIMHGNIETSGMYWGSISNDSYERLVRNVYSDINFTSTHVGDNTAGGFFGMIRTGKDIENCIYAGDINLPGKDGGARCARVGGFAGWTHARTTFKNCAVLGNINGAGDQTEDNDTENSGNIARNYGNVVSENVYVLNPIQGNAITDQDKYTVFESGEAGVASGELAFFLNGKLGGVERFYQRIGTDVEPLPVPREGGLVYASAASYTCDGTPVGAIYQNTPAGDPVLDPHDFDDMGICNNCGALDENFMTPVDGWYEISTPEQFLWWSNYASKHLDASAKLMEDIDLDAYNELDDATGRYITPRFAQVGSEYAPFYGNFDGQRHTISNLNINLLGKRGCGLISVMNSQPDDKLSDRGLTADQARAEEGVYVKDVILDETCSITGGGYTGIVGMGSPWAGHITITGCMNLGNVYVVAGTNGSGMYGCSMGSACRVTINACGVIGDIHVENDDRTENGSFSGWLGSYAEVTNCFGLGTVELPDPNRSFARHPAGAYDNGTVIVKNCYALNGVGIKQQDNNGKEDVAFVDYEDLLTGAVTWKANGYQFRDPVWYQTLEEDEYPYPFDTHAVVIYAAEQYFSAETNKDIEGIASEVKSYEEDALSEVVATQSLIDKLNEVLEAMANVETFIDFADALDSVSVAKAAIAENAKVYEAYIAECERVSAYLAEHDDFAGEARTALESYLAETDEPSEDNPLGTYAYIIENHTATAEEIAAETERVTTWLATAIAGGYIPGTDVSSLIPNGDFSKKNEGWTNGFATAVDPLETGTIVGVEGWNVQGDMYQTVEGLKPGYYLVGTHAAFRPSNDRYSTNYAAGIYANGVFNYFPAAIEGAISVDEAIDGVNSNITIKAACDLPVYDDGFTTEGEGMSGYVVQGPYGMAIAGSADRYEAYTIAFVGEDGKLTIGIKNPGTKYGNDWTGWTSLKVTYCGDDAEKSSKALDKVLENMVARANTLIQYHEALFEGFEVKAPASPNFPTELKTGLETAIAQVEGAETVEAKAALAAKFSELFEAIYEGKQAYVTLNDAYTLLECLIRNTDLPLVEKDVETGDWYETGDMLLFNGGETQDQLEDISYDIVESYIGGLYSTEEALDAAKLNIPAISEILPAKDEDGYYLISNPKQFVVYRAIASNVDAYAKAKLTADIDMAGIAMKPFGGEDNTPGKFYRGKLDGQNHALTNLYISGDYIRDDDPATLFYEIKGTTIKNLKITGEYYTKAKFMGGLTRWASEGNTVDNVEIAVVMHSLIDGDGTHGGVFGVCNDNTVLSNCIVNCTMIGEGAEPTYQCAGVCGWGNSNFTVKNTLILSQYVNITKGQNGNVIGRNGYTANNVFYIERSNPDNFDTGGTLVTDDQLASGEITWKLNGSTADNAHWFQTLGVDAMPRLFDGATVYYYAGKYINEKPNPQLNAFAFNLDAKLAGQNVVVSFNLNAEAEGVEVNFYNGEDKVYTAVSDEVYTAGAHKVTVPASELGSDPTALNFDVAVTGKGSLEVTKMDSYKVWGPYGMAINNNPASKGFGQVLLAESWVQDYVNGNNVYHTGDKVGALYAFDADFQPINAADGTPGFYGGLDIAGETPLEIVNGYCLDLMDLRFTEDGRLFVARSGAASNSSVWEINPEDLNEPWKPVFTGGELDEATGITYVGDDEQNRMAISLAFEGKGDDLKMYVLGGQRSNGEVNSTDFNCALYSLGTATEWTTAPTGYVGALDGVYVGTPYQAGIYADGQGGLWFLQRTSASAETPSIKHFDAEGNEDYSNTSSQYGGGRMTVTADGNYLAIPTGSGTIVLYETNYVPMENGKIFLNPKQTINVGESSIASMAFDYANNLYVASGGTETFSRYTIPGMNKVVVTPGNGIVEGGLEGDLNNDGKVDVADAVTVLNEMALEEPRMACDVNGDGKVDIADFVTILNLMAAM